MTGKFVVLFFFTIIAKRTTGGATTTASPSTTADEAVDEFIAALQANSSDNSLAISNFTMEEEHSFLWLIKWTTVVEGLGGSLKDISTLTRTTDVVDTRSSDGSNGTLQFDLNFSSFSFKYTYFIAKTLWFIAIKAPIEVTLEPTTVSVTANVTYTSDNCTSVIDKVEVPEVLVTKIKYTPWWLPNHFFAGLVAKYTMNVMEKKNNSTSDFLSGQLKSALETALSNSAVEICVV